MSERTRLRCRPASAERRPQPIQSKAKNNVDREKELLQVQSRDMHLSTHSSSKTSTVAQR